MRTLVFDIETDGLLDELTRVHCLVIRDFDTGEVWSCTDDEQSSSFDYCHISHGLALLADADLILGHNVVGFDLPAIRKVYPDWSPRGIVRDTLLLSNLLYPKEVIEAIDFGLVEKGRLPKNLIGRHALEAWGHRLGEYKGDYKGPWDTWSPTMQEYCEQDVAVTCKLWERMQKELADGWGEECVRLEHDLAWVIQRQERRGFAFDVPAAQRLYSTLSSRRSELADDLMRVFPPKEIRTVFIPKVNNKTRGYEKGVPTHKVKVLPFNPGSRKQVAERMVGLGWRPTEFTKDGTPKLDDDILGNLPHPQAKVLAEYFLVAKRLGQLGDGREAWIRKEKRGRVFGRVIQNGAVTGRMTHRIIANVPRIGTPYGKEMRALFRAGDGYTLVGCDADGLELRCLAGYLARFDGGAFVRTVLEGRKEDGTDMHSLNAKALGCDRDTAKTWIYGFLYGAGDAKLGSIVLPGASIQRQAAQGKRDRAKFLATFSAMGKLVNTIARTVKQRGYLLGLDGRKLRVRSEHSALNTLLQSAGAILMKKASVILDADLQAAGLVPGEHYEYVLHYHDEIQLEARPEVAETVGRMCAEAMTKAGEFFSFRCPLKGNYDIGPNWGATH